MVNKDKWGVHRTHCCKKHGCKYGDKDCPVELGLIVQDYPCMDGDDINDPCFEDTIDFQMKYDEYRKVLEGIEQLTKNSSNGEIYRIHEMVKNVLK